MKIKHTIWSSDIGDIKDWEDENGEQLSYEEAEDLNDSYLYDERCNLDVATDGEIVLIGTVQRWNGYVHGGKPKGHRISNILYGEVNGYSECTWYSDGKDIRCAEAHHDGTNDYLYREMKPGKDMNDLFSKPITPRRLGYYTKSLEPRVRAVYGWS